MPGALINGGTGAGSVGDLAMTGSGANGVNLKMTGNTSLSKTFRVLNGHLQIMSNGYTSLFDLDDSGFLTLQPGTAIPVTGTADLGVLFSSTADFGITYLSGTPNITMARGTLALMNGAGGMPWVNTDGTPSGWVQLAPSVAGGYLPLSGGTVTGPVTFQGALTMPDGSTLRLRKLADDYDPHDRVGALAYVQRKQDEGEVVTGLLYLDANASDCHAILETVDTPLNELGEVDLCPGNAALKPINASFR